MLVALSIAYGAIEGWWNALEVMGIVQTVGHSGPVTEGDVKAKAVLVFLFLCLAMKQAIIPNQLC